MTMLKLLVVYNATSNNFNKQWWIVKGGVMVENFWNQDFEITCIEVWGRMAECRATLFLGPNKGPEILNLKINALLPIFHNQSIDDSIRSWHVQFEHAWSKNSQDNAKNVCPYMGICSKFAHFWPIYLPNMVPGLN